MLQSSGTQWGHQWGHRILRRLATFTCLAILCHGKELQANTPTVVFNEVHYHPADDSRVGEFVEFYNFGSDTVDVGGWFLTGGVQFLFPPNVKIEPRGFLLVVSDRGEFRARYDVDEALIVGTYAGNLDNGGERLELWTPGGYLASFIEYDDSGAWPALADGLGPSLERVSPWREESDPTAWMASMLVDGTPGEENAVRQADPPPPPDLTELVPVGADWRFFRGTQEPPADWRALDFDDVAWEEGSAGFGYGDDDDATVLDDMPLNYLSVYLRRRFDIEAKDTLLEVFLQIDYDDAFVAHINGTEFARQNIDNTAFDGAALGSHEAGAPERYAVPLDLLREGTNVLAVQGHNVDLQSSDFTLAPALFGVVEIENKKPEPNEWERPPRDLVINEMSLEWIELYNPTATAVDVGGRKILVHSSDIGDGARRDTHTIAGGTEIPSGGHLVLTADEMSLSLANVATVLVATADNRFIDGLNPRLIMSSQSTGRFPDGADNRRVFSSPSPGDKNSADPMPQIVINEIMYRPGPENNGGEFVELLNAGDRSVDISGWSFTRGISYTFRPDTILPPGGLIVIAADPTGFESHYDIQDVTVVGPFVGGLNNDAETLLLRNEIGNPADTVRYADEGSWPENADGMGPSLELLHPALDNRHGPAWAASEGDGSPGKPNSQFTKNPTPVVAGVSHSPVIPTTADSVRVLATVTAAELITFVTLSYEVDGSDNVEQLLMRDDGVGDDGVASNGVYGADIAPHNDRSIVAFWIRAESTSGLTTTVPEGQPRSAFLFQVVDRQLEEARPWYRIIMRGVNLNWLLTRGVGSNELADLTFVANGRAYYNRGIRYRGSSARSCNPLSYRIQFDHDRDFHGIKRLNLNGCNTHRQWIGLDFLRRTGLKTPRVWFRRLAFNGLPLADWHLRVEAIDDQFLEHHLPLDDDGNLYRGEGQANLDYRGEDFDRYRGHYVKRTNERDDDYSDVVDLCFRFDRGTTSDADFPVALEERIDVDEWALFFAAFAILGSTENSILLNNGDDYFLYRRFSDDRWILLPWDLDSCFDEANQVLFRPTVDAIERFLEHPRYAPDYWCYLESFIDAVFVPDLINHRIDHLEPLFLDGRLVQLRDFVDRRRAYIDARLHRSFEVTTSGGTVCGNFLFPTGDTMSLSGVAPGCGTTQVRLNGTAVSYDPISNSFSGSVDVSDGDRVTLAAFDRDGVETEKVEFEIERLDDTGREARIVEQELDASHIAFKATEYHRITDPDMDGNVWLEVPNVNGSLGRDQTILRAPPAGAEHTERQSWAIYALRFRTAGVYRAYFHARGFDRNTDSVFRPSAFNQDPFIHMRTGRQGQWLWTSEQDSNDFVVTQSMVDNEELVELRIGVREYHTEFDAVVMSVNPSLSPATLGELMADRATPAQQPRARAIVRPSAQVELRGGAASVTLDGSLSDDGSCGNATLTYLWEKTSGPAGATFDGDPQASVVSVTFTAAGEYRYRLTVANPEAEGVTDTASVTVTVTGGGIGSYTLCDSNGDGANLISDPIFTLSKLFGGGRDPVCAAAMDCNSDGGVNIADAIFNLNHLFAGGVAPRAPYPDCESAPSEECGTTTCVR